jgi:hypothetical protein
LNSRPSGRKGKKYMASFTKEYPPGENGIAALITPDQEHGESRLKITLAKVINGQRPNWDEFDYTRHGFWSINKDEGDQIVNFLAEPYKKPNYDGNPRLSLKADKSYYLDVPGDPRIYVNVEKHENNDAEFSIGDNYRFLFLASELPEIIAALNAL